MLVLANESDFSQIMQIPWTIKPWSVHANQ